MTAVNAMAKDNELGMAKLELPAEMLTAIDAVLKPGETREHFVRAAARHEITKRLVHRGRSRT